MARGTKKECPGSTAVADSDPEAAARAKLKGLAFSTNLLSQKPPRLPPSAALAPSKTLIKHHGKDILRKSHRKNRFLFSFPALLAPISSGKIGDLKDLGTKNPILYLDFPQGQMKLFGTIVYPKNRYLTLQFSKGGKNVTCDDSFDNMIVFSDAWWIGKKEDNPEELQLQFPKELNAANPEGYDFKGGVGSASEHNQGLGQLPENYQEQLSPKISPKNNSVDSSVDYKELVEVTPTRHSARTAGKAFNFAEGSSGDDILVDGDETPEAEYEKYETVARMERKSSCPVVFEIDNEDDAEITKDPLDRSQTPLVQATLSSLFKKVEEKKAKKDVKQKRNTSEASKLMKGEKRTGERESVYQRKSKRNSSTTSSKKGNQDLVLVPQSSDPNDSTQVEDDDIEDFTSSSQDMDASDEDWNA